MRKAVSSVSLALAITLGAFPVLGADADHPSQGADSDSHQRTAARTLASEGTQAFERQDYEQALDLFDRALSLVQAPTLGLMRARTLVELGRWVEAVDTYATLPRGDEDPNNPAFRQAMDEATQELNLLLPRLPRLRVTVRGLDGARAEVRVDGRTLSDALVGVDNPLDPGTHRIEVLTPERDPEVRVINLAERDKKEIVIELAPPRRPEPVAPPPPPPPVAPPRDDTNVPAIAAFATGGAGAVLGIVTGSMALGHKEDLDAVCTPDCPPNMRDTLSAYRLERTLSYVGFGVGFAGAALGSYFLFREPKVEGARTLSLGIRRRGVVVSGTF